MLSQKTPLLLALAVFSLFVVAHLVQNHQHLKDLIPTTESYPASQSSSTQQLLFPPNPLHKQPVYTFLQLQDPETHSLVYAFDNPVYQRLATTPIELPPVVADTKGRTHGTVKSRQRYYSIQVNTTRLHAHDPIRVVFVTAHIDNDDDLVLLQCTNDVEKDFQKASIFRREAILEAASIRQIRSSSSTSITKDRTHGEIQWDIPDFPVTNHAFCRFVILADNNDKYSQVAESPVMEFVSVTIPRAIHLAYTAKPATSMTVSFSTASSGTPLAVVWTDRISSRTKFEGTTRTYTAQDLCGAPANITDLPSYFQTPGYLHTVILDDLEPHTRYQYQVGLAHGQGTTWSESASFVTAISAGDSMPFSYVMYGDQGAIQPNFNGLYTASLMTSHEIPQHNITSVHHVGDLSYANGAAHIWENWMDLVEPFAQQVPLMIAVGNHEYDHTVGGSSGKDPSGVDTDSGFMPIWGNFGDDSGGECGVPTAMRFQMPNSTASNGVFWYSYDVGLLHTTVISSEHDLSLGSVQYEWLKNDLESVDRTLTPWLVLESHRPLYEGEAVWPNNAVGIAMRYEIEDLLYDTGVDLVLSGHYHAYHRTCDGLYRNQCDSGGPMHITVGTAGAALDAALLFDNSWTESFIEQVFGYSRVTVQNRTHLLFEFVKAGMENGTSTIDTKESFWVVRPFERFKKIRT